MQNTSFDSGFDNLCTLSEYAAFISSAKDQTHKAFAVDRARKLGEDFQGRLRSILAQTMSASALSNLWSLGNHIVPIMERHGFAASVNTVQHAIRVLFIPGTEQLRPDPVAHDVYERLKRGTIHQPEIRRLARLHKLGVSPLSDIAPLCEERDNLIRRLQELNSLLMA